MIKIQRCDDPITLFDFADLHNLDLVITERSKQAGSSRYYAQIEQSETKEFEQASILKGSFGNGATIFEALENYSKEIAGKYLVLYASNQYRRKEILVPATIGVD